MDPIAYTIDDVIKMVGIGRTKLYEAIGSGQLQRDRPEPQQAENFPLSGLRIAASCCGQGRP
ncbi:MAG: hypothetical protein ABI398_12665 [Devosia sp.]